MDVYIKKNFEKILSDIKEVYKFNYDKNQKQSDSDKL